MRYKIGNDPSDKKAEIFERRAKPQALPSYPIQTFEGLRKPLGHACTACAASKAHLHGLGATPTSPARWIAYGAIGLGALFLGMVLLQGKE